MGRVREAWRRRKYPIIYGTAAAVSLAALIPVHAALAYRPVSGRNAAQLAALARREDVRPQGFTFAVCGNSRGSRYVWEGILRSLGRDETAFCVHLGGAVHSPGLTSYAYCLRQLDLLGKPLLMLPGDSETAGSGEGLFREIFGEPYYSFTAGSAYFILLDDSGGGGLGSEQEEWLRGELEKSRAWRVRMVFMHRPLFDPEGGDPGSGLEDPEEALRLQGLFDEYGVTAAFASHARGVYQGTWGRTPYVVTGGAGAPIESPDDACRYHNFVKVSVFQDQVDFEVVRTPGPPSAWKDRWGYQYSMRIYGFFALWFWWHLLLLAAAAALAAALSRAMRHIYDGSGAHPPG